KVATNGEDHGGRDIQDILRTEGVSDEYLDIRHDMQTGYSMIIVAGSGERTILVYRGASKRMDEAHIAWDALHAKWIYLTSLGGNIRLVERVLDHAKHSGAYVAWNPGGTEIQTGYDTMASLMRRTDIVTINREEAAAIANTDRK